MTLETRTFLNYSQIRERMRRHPLRRSEIPVEHAISLPLPTLRFTTPGYAFFASPTVRRPGTPVVQSSPDRWWTLSAAGAHLEFYALVSVFPLNPAGDDGGTIELPDPGMSIPELQASLNEFELLMDATVGDFFFRQPADSEQAALVSSALSLQLPGVLMEQYRTVASDFFQWLEAAAQKEEQ